MTSFVLEVLEGKDAGLQLPLTNAIDAGCQPGLGLGLTLDDRAVAAQHARFTVEQGEVTVEDLGSATGTYVNELQVLGRSMIRPGDRIRLGMTVVELVTEQQAIADRSRPRQPRVPALDSTVLEHVPEHELASGHDTRPAPLLAEATDASFVLPEALDEPPAENRFGALGAWTDSHVKHQTQLAAFGLLAVAALAVALVFFH